MSGTRMHTPWGYPQDIEELAEGIWRVSTAGHGGLKLSRERWEELPDLVRDTFLNPTFAEEDCEEPIARTLLGIGDEREREFALKVAGSFRPLRPGAPLPSESGRWVMAATTTRPRPRSLPSVTTKLATELGNLYVTVCLDDDGWPFEVFGSLGKAGSLQHGVTELACRLVSLHLRRGTPIEEIVDQCQGISEMQPWPNVMEDGSTVYVRGLGDAIALILRGHLDAQHEAQDTELKLAAD